MQVHVAFHDIFQTSGPIKAHELSFQLLWIQDLFHAMQLEIN